MSIEITPITESMVEVSGMVNSAGQPEVYRVRTLWNGQREVLVQRKNGSFAQLNRNIHAWAIGRVLRAVA
jgi:hypothetical protein